MISWPGSRLYHAIVSNHDMDHESHHGGILRLIEGVGAIMSHTPLQAILTFTNCIYKN